MGQPPPSGDSFTQGLQKGTNSKSGLCGLQSQPNWLTASPALSKPGSLSNRQPWKQTTAFLLPCSLRRWLALFIIDTLTLSFRWQEAPGKSEIRKMRE